jgi:phosphatidylserine/phosphatidylglycerophosphate/cardiolipin synthase-like enzyme
VRSGLPPGSFNYSEPATLFNDEALIVIGSPYAESEHIEVDRTACKAIANFFGAEIARIAADSSPWTDAA